MGQPRSLFRSFQTNINTIFTVNQYEKMSIPSSLWHLDSNPRPLDHESSPITTRPGFTPKSQYCFQRKSQTYGSFERGVRGVVVQPEIHGRLGMPKQRTLTIGESITVQLVSFLTGLDLVFTVHTNKTNFLGWSNLIQVN